MRCPNCGFENPPQFRFCGQCGTRILGPTPAIASVALAGPQSQSRDTTSAAPPLQGRPEAERRQLTVLFCDLADSTALSQQLDPEVLREVVRDYQEAGAKIISQYDGHIAQYLGDGLLVYFGYPRAHEDDVRRAVLAALGIVESIEELNEKLVKERGITLAVRLGVHTGLVVIGEVGSGERREHLALGKTPNIAARLQSLAQPNTIVVSAETQRLIHGFFVCESLGRHSLKGIAGHQQVYRVLQESVVKSRLEAAGEEGLTPLVGKDQEIEILLHRWAKAGAGHGQVVILNGEAGIGKSRLVRAFSERLAEGSYSRIDCRCSSYHQNTALFPFIDLLQRMLAHDRSDSPLVKVARLEELLHQYGLNPAETVSLFASLLTVPHEQDYTAAGLISQQEKKQTIQHLVTLILRMAKSKPVLFVMEDMQWLDPTTLELMNLLVDEIPQHRILAVLICRPAFQAPWPPGPHITQLTLNRLPPTQVEIMIAQVTAGKRLPAEVLQQLVDKTDGIPLFAEELTKMVLESEWVTEKQGRYVLTGASPLREIPSTLHDSLMARLDRLGTAKDLAQIAAAIGHEFTYGMIRAVAQLPDAALGAQLARLVEAELLDQEGTPPQATYTFRQSLIQETAHQALLKTSRQVYHHRIAQVLIRQFPETAAAQPELLAYHFQEAGINDAAVAYWQWAGENAIERSANLEAISHLTNGLRLLEMVPESPELIQLELDLQTTLGPALMSTKGYAAPEVERAYARARELCQQAGEPQQLFPALWGLWVFHLTRAGLRTAQELTNQLGDIARQEQDPEFIMKSHHAFGVTALWLGQFDSARQHLEQGIELYDFQKHGAHALLYGQDPGVVFLSHTLLTLWLMGFPDQALEMTRDLMLLIRKVSHPFDQVFALLNIAMHHQFRQETQPAQQRADEVITLCGEQGFPLWLALATVIAGWALAKDGKGEVGIGLMRQGLAAYQGTGAELARPYYLALLAETYMQMGKGDDGIAALDEALAEVQKNGERFYAAEIHRLKGELLMRRSRENSAEAEKWFRQAIEIARSQQAKSLELRAAMSLYRLLRDQDQQEARRRLAETYEWFTEGFDTADLRQAKALLDSAK